MSQNTRKECFPTQIVYLRIVQPEEWGQGGRRDLSSDILMISAEDFHVLGGAGFLNPLIISVWITSGNVTDNQRIFFLLHQGLYFRGDSEEENKDTTWHLY